MYKSKGEQENNLLKLSQLKGHKIDKLTVNS